MNEPDKTYRMPTAHARVLSISREEIATLPIKKYEGTIHVVDNDQRLAEACAELREESLLGFDIETRPSFHVGESYPPALLQLAGSTAVFVFRLKKLAEFGPLFELLSNVAITKAGVAIAEDLKKLRGIREFEPAGFIDIGILAREQGFKQNGLRTLAGLLLGFRVSKREQRSNWAALLLTHSQIVYAATDAWASRELYFKLAGRPRPA